MQGQGQRGGFGGGGEGGVSLRGWKGGGMEGSLLLNQILLYPFSSFLLLSLPPLLSPSFFAAGGNFPQYMSPEAYEGGGISPLTPPFVLGAPAHPGEVGDMPPEFIPAMPVALDNRVGHVTVM